MDEGTHPNQHPRNCQSQHSKMAKSAIISNAACDPNNLRNKNKNKNITNTSNHSSQQQIQNQKKSLMHPSSKTVVGRALGSELHQNENVHKSLKQSSEGVGTALTDTPVSTAPSSPQM
jgi:6-phosphofructo-2-kinase